MPQVIDLTVSGPDSDSDDEESEDARSELSSASEPGADRPPPLDDASRTQLHRAIATVSEDRLRLVVAELAQSVPQAERALLAKLVTTRKNTKRKREAVPKWETCGRCGEGFDAGERRQADECVHHPGELEVDDASDTWDDWDEDVHGPMNTSSNRANFPEGFVWSCCREAGTAQGCEEGQHVMRSSGKRSKH